MRPNDETIVAGATAKNEENPQVTNENKKSIPWKTIGLGSATGILMGAGALYASNAMASGTPEMADNQANAEGTENGGVQELDAPVAKVKSSDSFEHAFAEAREQVGPGGVFQWHGGIYNTFTKEEWDMMSDEEKLAFSSKVHPEYTADKINAIHITEQEPDIYVDKLEIHEHYHVSNEVVEDNNDDVHVIGYAGTDEVVVNGQEISVENYMVDGHHAAVVNFHDENEHDIAWVDKNDNLNVDDGESKDIVTGEVLDRNWNPMNDSNNLMADADNLDASAADVANI